MSSFSGYHSEWNLGSPGGWDYQRMTQEISKVVWRKINDAKPTGVNLDFDHPMLYPVVSFAEMLISVHREREEDEPLKPECQQDPAPSRRGSQDHALGEELASNTSPGGSQGRPHGELGPAEGPPG